MATTVGIQIPKIWIIWKPNSHSVIKWFGIQMTSADLHLRFKIQWGSEYWTFRRSEFKWLGYSFNINHLNVLLTNGRFSNDWAKAVTIALVPTIWKPDIQNVRYLFLFQKVGLFGIQMAFENGTIWHLSNFRPFEIQTSPVLGSPL